jgi:hypothetical protein
LTQAGWKMVVADSVYIHHKGSTTFNAMGFNDLLGAAYYKLLQKWGNAELNKVGIDVTVKQQ